MKVIFSRFGYSLIRIIGVLLLLTACKKDEVQLPQLFTARITDIKASTAKGGGKITFDGGDAITACGLCFGLEHNPAIDKNKTSDTLYHAVFNSNLKNLVSDTVYYVRAYALNSAGIAYGKEVTFRTLKKTLSAVTTKDPVEITSGAFKAEAEITNDGRGVISACGFCWDVKENPTLAGSKSTNTLTGNLFALVVDGLIPEMTYYIRAYATNEMGTSYGNQVVVKTLPIAQFSTFTITPTTYSTMTASATITTDYGTDITERGFCWAVGNDPVITNGNTSVGKGTGNYSSEITQLTSSTVYFVRAYARNKYGIKYSISQATRTPIKPGTVVDASGNVYKCISIGNQTWMGADLKTAKYRNGDIIPGYVNNTSTVGNVTTYYTNPNYGKFYNWYAITDPRNIAPAGWHVATDADWTQLETNLGGSSVAGGLLKESQAYWYQPNAASDAFGFTALPAGWRYLDGSYDIGFELGHWWSATESSETEAYYRSFFYRDTQSRRFTTDKKIGMAVRCVMD